MTKISSLTALTGAGVDTAADLIEIVDTSAATNKKITVAELLAALQEGIDDRVAALLTAGANVTLTYDDASGTLEVAATPPGPGDISGFNEAVDDRVAALITAGSGIGKSYDDAAGTLTLTASVPAAYTDEDARDAIGTALTAGNGISVTVDDAGDTITLKAVGSTVSTQTGTSYTAVLGDANTFIRFTNGSPVTFTIPPNSSVAFPVGTVIEFSQSGTGAVTVAEGSGVTINSRSSDLTLAGQYAVAFVKKVDTDTWIMNGDL